MRQAPREPMPIGLTGRRQLATRGAGTARTAASAPTLPPVLRRFRPPVAVRVTVDRGRPVRARASIAAACPAAPSTAAPARGARRAPGGPDAGHWDRDEWDVALERRHDLPAVSAARMGGGSWRGSWIRGVQEVQGFMRFRVGSSWFGSELGFVTDHDLTLNRTREPLNPTAEPMNLMNLMNPVSDSIVRTPRLLRVLVSRRRVAAGSARRRAAELGLLRRWRCSIAMASTARRGFISRRSGPGCKAIVGAELTVAVAAVRSARACGERAGAAWSADAGARASAAAPRRLARGLSQSVPADHADEAARAERRRRAHARRSRWPRRRAGGAGRAGGDQRAALRRRRARRSARRRVRRATVSRSSCSATCCATRSPTTMRSSISRRRSICRWSPPTACASPSRPIGRSTTSSPASATRPRSRAPDGG